jgi:uncharacterized membrane protein YeaQ/YmgE (transglycosylase-associated protein family)
MGGLGAFLSVLIWAKELKEVYSFYSLKSIVIGFIVGYIYSILNANYNFPDLIMSCVAGYFGKDFIESLFERLKGKPQQGGQSAVRGGSGDTG